MCTLSRHVLELTDCGCLQIQILQDEALLCAVFKVLDHSDREHC